MQFPKKSIGIFGLGITGISVYKHLLDLDYFVICYDDKKNNRDNFASQFGDSAIVSIDDIRWEDLDAIVVSPGVFHSHYIFELARARGILITSDIELFTLENSNSDFVLVTGTNGKSTSTALTGHILERSNAGYHIGGNIGKAVMSLPYGAKGYVLEVSSFQLELLNEIDAKIAVITNITPDHLDRYSNLDDYIRTKEKIFTSDSLKIVGVNSDISRLTYDKFKHIHGTKIIPVSNKEFIQNGIFCNDKYLLDDYFDQKKYLLSDLPKLRGIHNKENIAISYAISRALGIGGDSIINSLESFSGLAYRMEYLCTYKNIDFYNDSKATNISSALSSLSAFNNIIWFAGGRFKESSFEGLDGIIQNIQKVYLFGESKYMFAKYLDSKINYEICSDLEEAFFKAIEYAKLIIDDKLTFLLAPACSSYDQFKNFEERGAHFENIVKQYIISNPN